MSRRPSVRNRRFVVDVIRWRQKSLQPVTTKVTNAVSSHDEVLSRRLEFGGSDKQNAKEAPVAVVSSRRFGLDKDPGLSVFITWG